jgi:hypothetical protein
VSYLWPAVLIAVSLVGISLAYWALRGQRISLYAPTDLERYAQPIDLLAFQALFDDENDHFLRANLPPAELRAFQRERCRIAAGYAKRIARNAAVLTHLGELARASDDTETARAGAQLANDSLQLRLLALAAYARMRLEVIHPAAPERVRRVLDVYESVADRAARVASLLEPASGMRCSRSLYSH